MKKSLLISIDFPPEKGGVATYLSNLCASLPKDKITVLANKHKREQAFDDKQNYKIIRKQLFYDKYWPKWLKTYFIAKKIIQKQQIKQIVISHVIPMGYICLLLRLQYVVILHGYDILLAKKSIWKLFWLKIILNKSNHILVNSQFTKGHVEKVGIKTNKIAIIYPYPNIKETDLNTTEEQIIKNELELSGKKVLLSVGRLVKRKGIDNVIKTLPDIIKKIPNLVYLIVGNGEYKTDLDKLAVDLQVRGNIIFLENVPDSHLPCLYDLSDIFIQPSRIENQSDVEGFGIVYLEANLFGKPVIAGNIGGAVEAVKDNYSGILVDPNNCSAIKNAIFKLFDNPKLMNKLGKQGKLRVKKEFQLDKQLKKLEGIL